MGLLSALGTLELFNFLKTDFAISPYNRLCIAKATVSKDFLRMLLTKHLLGKTNVLLDSCIANCGENIDLNPWRIHLELGRRFSDARAEYSKQAKQ